MSKRAFIVFFTILTVIWAIGVNGNFLYPKNVPRPEKKVEVAPSVNPIEEPGTPQSLYIPKLQVSAPVESLGMDGNGRMAVPQDANSVAWYNLGFKPGERGSAVMAGHLDKVTGEPAIFYYLYQLSPGDEIFVTDDKGKEYRFVVNYTKNYNFDSFPLPEVFADSKQASLNLITCNGNWDSQAHNYSHRIVVFSKLVN